VKTKITKLIFSAKMIWCMVRNRNKIWKIKIEIDG